MTDPPVNGFIFIIMLTTTPFIGVFDSGVGGLTVAVEISRLLPHEPIVYVADNARAPYGDRPATEVRSFSEEIVEKLVSKGAKMIVIACNTATSVAIDGLRERYPYLPFVGMEPAVKPAARETLNGRIGIMATALTLASERYHSLLDRFARDARVYSDPCLGLVPLIEKGHLDDPAIEELLHNILEPMLAAEVDTVALGCTHYPLVIEAIKKICGPEVKVINPAPAAARQVQRLLEKMPPGVSVDYPPLHRFYASGSTLALTNVLANLSVIPRLVDRWE